MQNIHERLDTKPRTPEAFSHGTLKPPAFDIEDCFYMV